MRGKRLRIAWRRKLGTRLHRKRENASDDASKCEAGVENDRRSTRGRAARAGAGARAGRGGRGRDGSAAGRWCSRDRTDTTGLGAIILDLQHTVRDLPYVTEWSELTVFSLEPIAVAADVKAELVPLPLEGALIVLLKANKHVCYDKSELTDPTIPRPQWVGNLQKK